METRKDLEDVSQLLPEPSTHVELKEETVVEEESSLSVIRSNFNSGHYETSRVNQELFDISQSQNKTLHKNFSGSVMSGAEQITKEDDEADVLISTSDQEDDGCVERSDLKSCENGPGVEQDMIFECKVEEDSQTSGNCQGLSLPLLGAPATSAQSLDDYIDVVTTYKCKFCLFSCCWKSGLKSHIRNCHLGTKNSKAVSVASSKSANVRSGRSLLKPAKEITFQTKLTESVEDGVQADKEVAEQHIFLCGECSKGFGAFDQCRKHMVQEHQLNLPGMNQDSSDVGRELQPDDGDYQLELEEDDNQDLLFERRERRRADSQRSGIKRPVKTPKDLQADFLLDNRKKRETKDTTSDKPYRCSEAGCGCRFMSESNLEYHSQCHVAEDNSFACPECGNKFEQWRRLLLHLWKEHLVDLDLLTCAECGYKTYSQFKLDTHQKVHSDVRSYMCSTCGKRFKQLSQLRNHNVMHLDRTQIGSNGQKRWYNTQQCETCGRSFSDSKCLRKHQQAVHCKIKPYICNFCGHTSARKAMLQLHMRQHTGERPFSCEHCDYKTGDHNSLRRHRMRHTGSKPYKCPHCAYSCIQAISLKTHLKKKHPGSEGLFSCNLCGFRSVNRDNFAHHMSDHQRGIIPAADKPTTVDASPQLDLPQGSEALPANVMSAQLICSCLNVLTQEGQTVDLPPGCITVGENGTQTITIQIPTNADQETGEQYYLTIQQDLTPSTVTELMENGHLKLTDVEEHNHSPNESISSLQQGGTC